VPDPAAAIGLYLRSGVMTTEALSFGDRPVSPNPPARGRRAFTLIELLVVIAVIALLIGILLPALGRARDSGRSARCLANIRQLQIAATLYANDNGDVIWPGLCRWSSTDYPWGQTSWAYAPAYPDYKPGYLYKYLGEVDSVAACPANERRAASGWDEGENMFGGATPLNFDYTMVYRMEGAKMDMVTRFAHLADPSRYSVGQDPPGALAFDTPLELVPLSGAPLFVDESAHYYNDQYRDGAWSNWDQISSRHQGGGAVVYLQGHAEIFMGTRDADEQNRTPGDLEADDFYVLGRDRWYRMERYESSWGKRYWGWINAPR
jgi:prepilin-type N-terminal cleavage/methylation domain-containing protein